MAHILVIDDEENVRLLVAAILEQQGHQVQQADNGKTGMAAFRRTPPDLVITDLVMPEQEGVETILELRREKPGLPVIAMSGGLARSETYLDICRRLGVRATLSKPFGVKELLDVVGPALSAEY
ncbi:MAG: response regulator [Cephaloticoccus sp.]